MSEIVLSNSLDYKTKMYGHGTYKLTKSHPENTNSVVLNGSGGNELQLQINPRCVNLSKSFLSFKLNLGAQTTEFAHIFGDNGCPAIREVVLQTRGGVTLCQIPDVSNYLKMILRAETKLEDFISMDCTSGIFPSNSLPALTAGGNFFFNNAGDPAILAETNKNGVTPRSVGYVEPAYFRKTDVVGALSLSYKIPLSMFKNTILALDKDLIFNETLILKIIFNPINKIGFKSTAAGTSALGTRLLDSTADLPSISDFVLYTATQVDQNIVNLVQQKKNEGMNIIFDYVYYNKISLNNVSQSFTLKYNRTNGSKLKKIYWSAFHSTETNNFAYNNNNLAQAKIVSFYTTTNNLRNQEFDVLCANDDEYLLMYDKLRGSLVLNSGLHKINNVWIEDFTARDSPMVQRNDEQNLSDGLDLTDEVKYDVFATTAGNNLNHYVYSVCEKVLSLGPNGIMVI